MAKMKVLRLEIARPLDMTWDELGTILRTQRRVIPQLLRAGADALTACRVVRAEEVKRAVCPETRGGSPSAIAYQAMIAELVRIKEGKWPEACRPALELPGGMVSALQQRVNQEWKKRPSYLGRAQPIPIRKADMKVWVEDGAGVLDLKLLSKGRVRVVVRAGKGRNWRLLRAVAAGELGRGDCRIVRDDDRKKWYALLAREVEEVAPLTVDPSRALVVHRGMHNALYLMTTTGQTRPEPGAKLFAQLRGLEARMRDARRVSGAELGGAARGRGRRRRYEHYEALAGKRDRVVRTWCQQQAAGVVDFARRHGCALVVIEDYGGIGPHEDPETRRALVRFPLYQLKLAIAEALDAAGMQLAEVPAEYVSTTCPACGNRDARQHNYRTGVFHCAVCALERPADFVAALNMLRRADVDSSTWDERMAQFERLREAAKEA